MDKETDAIMAAYYKAFEHLNAMRDHFLNDMSANPQDYCDITEDDAYIWFIESF